MKTSKKVKLPFKKAYSWVKQRIWRLKYWVTSHTIHRRHIVDISKTSEDYQWGWIDADFRMELACMEILCDFVENENPNIGKHDWTEEIAKTKYPDMRESLKRQAADELEIRIIYEWWQREKGKLSFGTLGEYEKMNEMLTRLIKVRRTMWT